MKKVDNMKTCYNKAITIYKISLREGNWRFMNFEGLNTIGGSSSLMIELQQG